MTQHIDTPPCTVHSVATDFDKIHLKHPRIESVRDEVLSLIYPSSQSNILLLIGPTGAGKSTLMELIVKDLHKQHQPQMQSDPGLVPAIYVQASSSGESEFSWRLLFEDILEKLNGGDLDAPKQAYGVDLSTGLAVRPKRPGRSTLAGLRTAVVRGLRQRGTKVLIIDESAHIIQSCRKNTTHLHRELNTLKSLANDCGAQLILVGSYDLHDLISLSAQISRRTHLVHFERYREDRPEDIQDFQKCLHSFEMKHPYLCNQQLVMHWQSLMENCVGCIGTLSSVLTRALRRAEAAGAWTDSALEGALLTEAQVQQILLETVSGEQEINPSLKRHLLGAVRKRA